MSAFSVQAAKLHLKLTLQSFLPDFAIIDTARQSDAKRARELCAGISGGEIVIFDKAYVDFDHLGDLYRRGVCWVTRAKGGVEGKMCQLNPYHMMDLSSRLARFGEEFQAAFFSGLGGEAVAFREFSIQEVE